MDNDAIETFARDGAVRVRGAFSTDWLGLLGNGVEKNFRDPGPWHTVYTDPEDPGGFYDDYCNWQRIDEYRSFIFESPAANIAAQLMQSKTARLYHEHVLIKEPGTKEKTPWHHDQPYYGVDGQQLCSIWLPLDPVPQSACPEFVAGSHKAATSYYPRLFLTSENYADGIDGYQTIPDIDAQRDQLTIKSWHLEPGDCIVFHMRTVHGAPATSALKTRRRGFSTRWLGDDARFAKRAWTTSPPYPEVQLKPGDPMIHPSFPCVWPRET